MATDAVKIPFTEAAAPSTPSANKVVIYAKADGLMYSKDDAGVETQMSMARPPGYQYDYAERTSDLSVTATSGATAQTVVSGNSVTYDGSTEVMIEMYSDALVAESTVGAHINVVLYDGATELGIMGRQRTPAAANNASQFHGFRKLTPSAGAHTYHFKAYSSGGGAANTVSGGPGTAGNHMPSFIRITKV